MDHDRGTYALLLVLEKATTLAVGRLGVFSFPSGYYIYVGSAGRGLFHRVKRHVQGEKKLRWHIDYLRQHSRATEVWYAVSDETLECQWYQAVARLPQARPVIKGFGSSDCRCFSHLVYFPSMPCFEVFQEKLGEKGLPIERQPAASFLG